MPIASVKSLSFTYLTALLLQLDQFVLNTLKTLLSLVRGEAESSLKSVNLVHSLFTIPFNAHPSLVQETSCKWFIPEMACIVFSFPL